MYDGGSMVATLNEARERIYQTFVTGWGATSPFVFDNEKLDTPVDTDWVRVSVRHTASRQDTLGAVGNRKFLRFGSVIVQCFSKEDGGAGAAGTLAITARNLFEGKTLSPEGIWFNAVDIREIGASEGWYQINVEATFSYEQVK